MPEHSEKRVGGDEKPPAGWTAIGVLKELRQKAVGLRVERALERKDIAIKPLQPRLYQAFHVRGRGPVIAGTQQRRGNVTPSRIHAERTLDLVAFRQRMPLDHLGEDQRIERIESHFYRPNLVRQGDVRGSDYSVRLESRRREGTAAAMGADQSVYDGKVDRRGRQEIGDDLARMTCRPVVQVLVGQRQHADEAF